MSLTYKATGINLKTLPLGESDRLLTVLTKEYGLIKAVAPGSRKHQSRLRGLSELFVVNQLLIVKGRSLDKIIQADSLETYPGLSSDLRTLTVSQYLAELVLCQALSDQPQEELFALFQEQLRRLDGSPAAIALPYLVQSIYHLLAMAGIAPRVHTCCITQEPLHPDFQNATWRVGFSPYAGGTVKLDQGHSVNSRKPSPSRVGSVRERIYPGSRANATSSSDDAASFSRLPLAPPHRLMDQPIPVTAQELATLQCLAQPERRSADGPPQGTGDSDDSDGFPPPSNEVWRSLERLLRQYAQYHFEKSIRSAALIDTCFCLSSPSPLDT